MPSMQSSEVIIIGSGITGAALGYELARLGVKVLVLEQFANSLNSSLNSSPSATRYSYGGISYWAGTTPVMRSICAESWEIHRQLSEQLDGPTEFRELPLLGTIDRGQDPQVILKTFQNFIRLPELLTPEEAHAQEPLLNPEAIEAAIGMPYAQINALQTAESYLQAMERLGGQRILEKVLQVKFEGQGVNVVGQQRSYPADRVIVCAGGATRALLKDSGIPLRQYFSHAESIETAPCSELQMRTIVMPAEIRRFGLESSAALDDEPWNNPENRELLPPILDCGALQFADGSFRFGQISRTQTSLIPDRNPWESERWMRDRLRQILPQVADLSGQWVSCTVAFSGDHLPLVGAVQGDDRLQVFSGFSNPMALVPGTARRFAMQLASRDHDSQLDFFSPDRFT